MHKNDAPTKCLLSVVLPVLDDDYELERCISSIVAACHEVPAIEIVVVSPKLGIENMRKKFPMTRFVIESRNGIYSAMNDGILKSSGDYLYFLGKDDIVLPSFGEACKKLYLDRPAVLFCDVYWGSRGYSSGFPSRFKLLWKNICHQGVIYSRRVLKKHGPYLRVFRVQADHYLNIKIIFDRSIYKELVYFKKPIAWYSGAGFSSRSRDMFFWRLFPLILKNNVGCWMMLILIGYRRIRSIIKLFNHCIH